MPRQRTVPDHPADAKLLDIHEAIRANLLLYLDRTGHTRRGIAEAAGFSPSILSQILQRRGVTSLWTLTRLAWAMHMDLPALLTHPHEVFDR